MNLGIDHYPVSVASSFDLLVRESGPFQQSNQQSNQRQQGYSKRNMFNRFMFLQVKQGCKVVTGGENNKLVASVNDTFHKGITCYNCDNKGHYSNECPYVDGSRSTGGVNLLMRAITLTQNDPFVRDINPAWVLLDTCSTASVGGNPDLVSNIRKCEPGNEIHIATNGGGMKYDLTAQLNLFPVNIHYNEKSIATILALKDVASLPGCYLTMDTRVAREIVVCFEDSGDIYTFKECGDGLYYFDTSSSAYNTTTNAEFKPYLFLQPVAENKKAYTKDEIAQANKARTVQQRLGFPGTTTLVSYLRNN